MGDLYLVDLAAPADGLTLFCADCGRMLGVEADLAGEDCLPCVLTALARLEHDDAWEGAWDAADL